MGPEQEGALEGDLSRGWGRVANITPYGKVVFYTVNDALHKSGAICSLQPGLRTRAPLIPHMHQEHADSSYEGIAVATSHDEPVTPAPPLTVVNDAAAGTIDWAGLANIAADDGNYATATGTGGDGVSSQSKYLKGTNLARALPAGATINGILVRVKRSAR